MTSHIASFKILILPVGIMDVEYIGGDFIKLVPCVSLLYILILQQYTMDICLAQP